MDFERLTRRRRAQVALGSLLLMLAAVGATRWADAPRWLALALLLGLAGLLLAWRGLAGLRAGPAAAAPLPAFAEDSERQAQRLVLLESQLAQVPVALWTQSAGGEVKPLNARAHRLIAPGGALDRSELLARLAASRGAAGHELLRVATERGSERWLLAGSALNLAGAQTRLLALMPVESELEAETLRAWRQLVHVLTHEIMNSLTPIASLSRTAQELVAESNAPDPDLTLALEAVARRAESLARFVTDYRQVSDWPEPRFEVVELRALLDRLEALVGESWRARGGTARFELDEATLSLRADAGQLEQVLLNLIKNAADATAGLAAPSLQLSARQVRGGRLQISVQDNGPGVPPGLEADIFLPFFSARPGGSGIGLAVVRNLVHGMGGTVRCLRPLGGGGLFVLSF
ncbi:ATP-binding protein [Pelomonas sp. V22]|uniref:sensor histidine kinase n=1 Tax=Pelomonas sp. V22 TaxID=2822139 RepID=UPI0024A8B6A9|nr:ATP-binding protein [Pelomonas sp. V22]MDI4634989.1 ATP-binding protein [Pelomonas sp. V22]